MTTKAAIARLEKQAARLGLRIVCANGPDTDLFVISRDNAHADKLAVVSSDAASVYLDGYGHGLVSKVAGTMQTEQEILDTIKKVTDSYRHVLDCGPASVQINAPRALMQVEASAQLTALYGVLGEKRPRFRSDDSTQVDR